MSIKLRWLGFVCFEMVLPSGRVLITDPYIDFAPTCPIKWDEVSGADFIVITHGHWDHITSLGKIAHKFKSKVICSYDISEPISDVFDIDNDQMIKVRSGDVISFSDLQIEVKKGEHIPLLGHLKESFKKITGKDPEGMSFKELTKSRPPEKYSEEATKLDLALRNTDITGGEQLNFIFQTPDNIRTYIFSSYPYEFLRKQVEQSHVNIFIAQAGNNIPPELIAEFSTLSGAELVLPSHHDGGGLDKAHSVAAELKKQVSIKSKAHVEDIEIGKWYDIGMKINKD
jgi:L-ascorbate metabolism protein UlaG (beta-lactamase superfamily)